jgi:hypothetical protein
MSRLANARKLAFTDLLAVVLKLNEGIAAAPEARPEQLDEQLGGLHGEVRKQVYRFVRWDTANVLLSFESNKHEAAQRFSFATGAVVMTALELVRQLVHADIAKGRNAGRILDRVVALEDALRIRASEFINAHTALQASGEPDEAECRAALVQLQAVKGKRKAQATLKRYAPTGTLSSLKAEDRPKLLADIKRQLTLRSVK